MLQSSIPDFNLNRRRDQQIIDDSGLKYRIIHQSQRENTFTDEIAEKIQR